MIYVNNNGPELVATNYFHQPIAPVYCSVNAGAIRILLPSLLEPYLRVMRTGKYVIITRGAWPAEGRSEGVELLFEDDTDEPFALHLGAESFDNLPGDPGDGEWVVSVWTEGCIKRLQLPARWRRETLIPFMQPWE